MVDAVLQFKSAYGLFSAGAEAAQVTGLTSTFVAATFVSLSWNAAANAVSYNIYANGISVGSTADTSITISGLTPETLYNFQVAGADAGLAEGPRSTTLVRTTLALPEWTGNPFPLFDLGVGSTYDLKAFIAPAPTSGYTFASTGTALPSGVTLNGATGVLTFDGAGGLTDVSTYSFSYNDGISPAVSITGVRIQVKDDTIPTAPTNLQSASITPATFTLSWDAATDPGANIDGYRVYRNGVLFASLGVVTSYAVTGQAEGSTNSWRVSAKDTAQNEGPQSAPLSVQQTTSGLVFATNTPPFLAIVPGGAGFGMSTAAGSGRDQVNNGVAAATTIYFVTNLNLSGQGSLKAALQATGRRIIIPCVSGIINYQGQAENTSSGNGRNIVVTDGNMSYWGQCAPSPGLWVRGAKIYINTNAAKNIHYWHLAALQDTYVDPNQVENNGDCVGITGATTLVSNVNIIYANCAFMHSSDELADTFYGANNITFYQCLFAEPFHNANHPKGPHGYGPLLTNNRHDCRAAFLRNVLAHCFARHPATAAHQLTYANNVVYNPGDRCLQLEGRAAEGPTQNNIEGNVFMKGPSTTATAATPIHRATSGGPTYLTGSEHFLSGNRTINSSGSGWDDSAQANLISAGNGTSVGARIDAVYPSGYAVTSATNREEFVRLVMRYCGPRPTNRHAHFQRVLNHIEARLTGVGAQGAIINGPADFGGWPTLANNFVDHTQGADPIPGITTQVATPTALGSAGRTVAVSGYTLLEEWAHRKHNSVMP